MEISFFKQQELKKAYRRWKWAYFTAYANALFAVGYGFLITDQGGHTTIAFDPVYTTSFIVIGLVLAGLAWGIQRRLSQICLSVLVVIGIANIVISAIDEENPKDLIGSVIVTVLLFRGILGIRNMKKAMREEKQQKQSDENNSQPPPVLHGTPTQNHNPIP